MTVDRRALITLARVFSAVEPAEGCALLLGSGGRDWHLQRIWPVLNSWPRPQERNRRFSLDPREQLLAQRWARDRDLRVLGCAHSHPGADPCPSATDLALTVAPALMLIGGRPIASAPAGSCGPGRDQSSSYWGWNWACWWLPEAGPGEPSPMALPVAWRMDPDPAAASLTAAPLPHASS